MVVLVSNPIGDLSCLVAPKTRAQNAGMRAARRAEAQAASRDVYRKAVRRLAAELRGAGMALESEESWTR